MGETTGGRTETIRKRCERSVMQTGAGGEAREYQTLQTDRK